jgi:hypothetical protein
VGEEQEEGKEEENDGQVNKFTFTEVTVKRWYEVPFRIRECEKSYAP